jgi:16S rRNA (adenine1518-N6/adenine1519-N6)-dimethyltransferase
VELDHRLAAYLQEKYQADSNFHLLQGDACKMDYAAIFADRPYRCLANLPYSCGSVFLAEISTVANPPREMFVLLQKEMGDRLVAKPGSKAYGLLSVRLAWRYQITALRVIPPEVFFPSPEVCSAYLKLTLRATQPAQQLCAQASKLAACAFSQRRKKAAKLLQNLFAQQDLTAAFASLGLALDARAEEWPPEVFLRLAALLHSRPESTIRKKDV